MPLSRVREFIAVDGGPTPRDAVLLKSLLVVYEGIAWAADRPHYRQVLYVRRGMILYIHRDTGFFRLHARTHTYVRAPNVLLSCPHR